MALISINADFSRVAAALERIADAAERIAGPPEAEEYVPRVTQPSDIGRVDIHGVRAALERLHKLERHLGEENRRASL
jgi:hypothetical protein